MLLNLHVKNLALIDEVEVDFFDHLNILTGETGAGKSILIGSIEAALGGKCTKDMIRQDAEYALIELLFQVEHDSVKEALKQRDIFLEEGQVMITRKILPTRSVCRINGETVNLQTLREVASLLLDLHGQQENLVLKNAASQYIGAPIKGLKEVCRQQYHTYEALRQEYEQYENRGEEVLRELRFMEYEVKEIREAALKEGEDEQLEQQYKKQANAQKVRQALSAVHAMMDAGEQANVTSLLGQCIREMNGIEDVDRTTKSLYEQLGQLDALLGDFNRELSDYMADMTYDEKEFMEITARLDEINRLKTKYGNSIEKILAYAAQKEEELLKYQDLDAYRENLKKDYNKMNVLKYKSLYENESLSFILDNSRYIFSEPMKGLEFYERVINNSCIPFNRMEDEYHKLDLIPSLALMKELCHEHLNLYHSYIYYFFPRESYLWNSKNTFSRVHLRL